MSVNSLNSVLLWPRALKALIMVCSCKSENKWKAKIVGQILPLILLAFFVTEVVISATKLFDEKIAIVTHTEYEDTRLMPSLSICFRRKLAKYPSNGTQSMLNATR